MAATVGERNGKPEVRWRTVAGKSKRRQCKTKRAADKLCNEINFLLDLGRDWAPPDSRRGAAPTVAKLGADYLADAGRRLSPKTVEGLRAAINSLVGFLSADEGAPAPVTSLSRDNLHRWHAAMLQDVDVRTAATKLARASGMWRWASEESDTWEDVVPRWRRVSAGMVPAPRRIPAPTLAQVDQAIAAAPVEWMRRLLTFMRYTGLRYNQVLRLDWADVHLAERRLTIRPELGKSKQERRGRVVPLHSGLADELAGWGRREGPLVTGQPSQISKDQRRRPWTLAGIEVRQPYHGVRHALASHLRSGGTPEDEIGYLLGHAGGVTGVYAFDAVSMWPRLVLAVESLPVVGAACVPGVSQLDTSRAKASK